MFIVIVCLGDKVVRVMASGLLVQTETRPLAAQDVRIFNCAKGKSVEG